MFITLPGIHPGSSGTFRRMLKPESQCYDTTAFLFHWFQVTNTIVLCTTPLDWRPKQYLDMEGFASCRWQKQWKDFKQHIEMRNIRTTSWEECGRNIWRQEHGSKEASFFEVAYMRVGEILTCVIVIRFKLLWKTHPGSQNRHTLGNNWMRGVSDSDGLKMSSLLVAGAVEWG